MSTPSLTIHSYLRTRQRNANLGKLLEISSSTLIANDSSLLLNEDFVCRSTNHGHQVSKTHVVKPRDAIPVHLPPDIEEQLARQFHADLERNEIEIDRVYQRIKKNEIMVPPTQNLSHPLLDTTARIAVTNGPLPGDAGGHVSRIQASYAGFPLLRAAFRNDIAGE